ncbi:hypothetical protein ABBQ32_012288 [Trebouxia sp. C0010 RCD-2024]
MLSTRMGFWKIAHGQSSHLRRRYETDADRLLTDPAVKDMIAGKRTNTKNKHDNILLKNALHSVKAGQVLLLNISAEGKATSSALVTGADEAHAANESANMDTNSQVKAA